MYEPFPEGRVVRQVNRTRYPYRRITLSKCWTRYQGDNVCFWTYRGVTQSGISVNHIRSLDIEEVSVE